MGPASPTSTYAVRYEIDDFLHRHGVGTSSTQLFSLLSESGRLNRALDDPEYEVIQGLRKLIHDLGILQDVQHRIDDARRRILGQIHYLQRQFRVHIPLDNITDESFARAIEKRAQQDDDDSELDIVGAKGVWDGMEKEGKTLLELSRKSVHIPKIDLSPLAELQFAAKEDRQILLTRLSTFIDNWNQAVHDELAKHSLLDCR